MEDKSHWVFDYIMHQDKENNIHNDQTKVHKSFNEDNNHQVVKTDNGQNNDYSRKKDKSTFILKNPKSRESIASPSSSFFNPNKNNFPKSFNLKNLMIKDSEENEPSSLSYKKVFNFQKQKPKSSKNIKEISNSLKNQNYNYNFNPSLTISNYNKNLEAYNKPYREEKDIFQPCKIQIEKIKNKIKNNSRIQTPVNLPIKNPLKINSRESPNPFAKKRVSFLDINEVIPDDFYSENRSADVKELEKINNNNNNNNIINNLSSPNKFKKILKKDDPFKKENKEIPKKGSLIDLFDKERIKREIKQEFEKVFNDLDELERYSNFSIKTSSATTIDDLRVSFLDFTISLEMKQREIETRIKK